MPQAVVAVQSFIYAAAGTAAASVGFSSATAATIANAVVVTATATAKVALMAGINYAIARQNQPRPQGGLVNLTIAPDEPRRLQIGKRQNGGVLVDWYVSGSKNQRLYMIVYLGEGPMGQLTQVFAGGRSVHSTPLVHGTRTAIPGFRSTEGGTAGDRLWLTYYDGRPGQTANASLIAAGIGWTSNHIGTGCAYVIVEALWDSDNLRSPPSLAFELEGAKLYDRRLDSTAGGSGAHRANDPSTWAVSDNPAVALDHYLLGRYISTVKTFGVGLGAADVPYARFAALANLCDENVDLKVSGTQKRYRANGFLFADRSYADTIRDLCRAMNARPADFGGRIGVIDGEARTPVLTIYDADVIETAAEQYTPKRSWAELVSVVRGTYQAPAQNYQSAEYPRISDPAWITADGGSPREATIDFEMETDAERAQRLAYLFGVRERRQAQLTGNYGLRTVELEQGDWFIRAGGIFGAGKTFEVIDRSLDVATMTVTLTAFEVDPFDSAWDETAAQDPPAEPVASTDRLQSMEIPILTVTGITLTGTTAQLPAIKVEWSAPTDPRALQILVEAVPAAGGVPTSAIVDVETGEVTFTSGITDDTNYLVRARFVGTFTPSAWSSVYAVTTLGDYAIGEASSVPWSGVIDDNGNRPEDNADVTSANTAAAIAGQGAFATISSINSTLADSNNLLRRSSGGLYTGNLAATLGARAGTDIFRTDGITPMSQAEVRTIEGTSAAITGQGALATKSAVNLATSEVLNKTATNILYSGAVSIESLKPGELGANVTESRTAAAIAGQGWGATASQFAADNQYPLLRMPAGLARNGNFAQPFSGTARPPNWNEWSNGAGTFGTLTGLSGSGYLRTVAAGVVNDGITQAVFVEPGKKYLFAAEARRSSGSFAPTGIYISWRDASFNEITAQAFPFASTPTTSGQTSATPDGWNRWEIITTAPANAVYASIYALNVASFFGSVASGTGIEWRLLDLIPLQLVDELRADKTGNNTSAAITGQGALATKSNVDLSTSEVLNKSLANVDSAANTKLGGIAAGATVGARAGANLYRTDGSTVMSQAEVRTIEGTSAAITGQGALATKGSVDLATSEVTNKTATNILYSGSVSIESLKPGEIGANVTESRTAAAIAGQGWGATASETAASNAQVALGANAIGNSEFYANLSGWAASQHGGNTATMSLRSPGASWAMPTRGTLMVYQADAGTLGYVDVRWRARNNAGGSSYPLKVQPGDIVTAQARVSAHRCLCQLRIEWRNASGTILSYSGTPSNNANSSSSTEPDIWPLLSISGTAPANAAWAEIHIRKNPTLSGSDSYMFVHKPMLAQMQPGATVIPEYAPGTPLDVYSGADVTSANTAAAITGQGALATKSNVDLSTSEVLNKSLANVDSAANTKLGGIAAGATVGARAGTNLYRTDGSTVMSQAEVRTVEGTAASITGQGWGATASETAASNALVPTGQNAAPNSEFLYGSATFPPAGWAAGWNGTAGVPIVREIQAVDTNRRALKAVAQGTPANGTVFDIGGIESSPSSNMMLAVQPGDLVGASALLAHNVSASHISVAIIWRNATGGYVSETHAGVTNNVDPADNASDYVLASHTAIAPAGAFFAGIFFRVYCNGSAFAAGWAMEPMLTRLPNNQTVVPKYSPTSAYRNADITSTNTAAAITGQGALATLNNVATAQIASGAVSNVTAAYTAGTTGGTAVGDGWIRQQNVTLTSAGGVLLISAALKGIVASDVSDGYQSVRIRRGTTTLYEANPFNQVTNQGDTLQTFSAIIADTPAAGTYTYYIETTFGGTDISRNEISNRALVITELKR